MSKTPGKVRKHQFHYQKNCFYAIISPKEPCSTQPTKPFISAFCSEVKNKLANEAHFWHTQKD